MLISTKPEQLEAQACALDDRAMEAAAKGHPRTAEQFRQRAARLRREASELRGRRTDGVRFG